MKYKEQIEYLKIEIGKVQEYIKKLVQTKKTA